VLSLVDRTFAAVAAASAVAKIVPAAVAANQPPAIARVAAPIDAPAAHTASALAVIDPPARPLQKIEPTPGASIAPSLSVAPVAALSTEPLRPTQLAAPVPPPPAPVSVPAAIPLTPTSASGANVLVVDDSDVALKFIRNRLSAFGFNVDLASSGEEALVRVSENLYSFVFLDVMMEGLDGYQTCKAIKKRKFQNGHSPVVIMLTSRGGTVDKVRGTFAGCDAYLTKPLDETKMLRVLLKHDAALSGQIETYTQFGQGGNVPGASQSVRAPMLTDAEQRDQEEAARREFLARLDKSSAIR
jgi:two-component system, cell cycle response regulator